MITLYQIPSAWGLPSVSPFCAKVETYLRMTGIEYETKLADVRKAPKGKVPFIKHEGRIIADSTFILDYLKNNFGDRLDASLTPDEHAIGHMVKRTVEEGVYFCLGYSRWIADEGFKEMKQGFAFLPGPIRAIVTRIIRRRVRANLHGQGTGRHSREEIFEIGRRDFNALSRFLGEKAFILGDTPTSYDATLAPFIGSIIAPPIETPLKHHVLSLPNLKAYYDRMWQRFFSDWKPT